MARGICVVGSNPTSTYFIWVAFCDLLCIEYKDLFFVAYLINVVMRMGRLAQYKSVGRGHFYRRIDTDFFVKRTNGVGFDSLPTLAVYR